MAFACIALAEGAKGLTVHPRPDQRHVRPQDVFNCRELLASYTDCEFNIEGNLCRPQVITLARWRW